MLIIIARHRRGSTLLFATSHPLRCRCHIFYFCIRCKPHNTLFRQPIIDQRQQKLEGNVCFCLPTLLLFPALFLCKSKCPSVIIFYLPGELHLSLHSLSVGNEFYQLLSENVLVLSSFLKDILSR